MLRFASNSDDVDRVSIEALDVVVGVLDAAPAEGLAVREIAVRSRIGVDKARRCCAIVAERKPYHPTRSGGFFQRWHLRADYQQQLDALRGRNLAARRVPIEGVCTDCTCKLTPSDFRMKDGRPVLPECKRSARAIASFVQQATASRTVHRTTTESVAVSRRRLVRATIRSSEASLTMEELMRRTGLNNLDVSHALTTLLLRGEVVKLIRTRPGRAGIAAYALPGAVPDPLRAS